MSKRSYIMNIIKIFILVIALLVFYACASSLFYNVRVNGYTGGKPFGLNGKRIFVYTNEQAENPLFEYEVANKIKKALVMKGHIPVDSLSDAECVLVFNYGIDTGRPVTYASTYSTSHYELNIFTGQFERQPMLRTEVGTSTEFTRRLLLGLFETKDFPLSQKPKPIWFGDVISTGSSSDLRKVIDFLIIAGFEHFGEDTGEQKLHILFQTDERIKKLNY